MLDRLLPPSGDAYRGHRIALWIFGLVVLAKLAMSLGTILNGRSVAADADGIPLDTYGPAAAQTVVAMFALVGLAQAMLAVIGAVALARYRALVPLVLGVFILEYLLRRLILFAVPIARTRAPGGIINLVLLALMIVALALTMWRGRKAGS